MSEVQLSLSSEVFNPVYISFLFDKTRFFHLWGGAGSGKSKAIAQKIVYRMITDSQLTMLVVRKIARTIRRSAFQEIIGVINEWDLSELFDIRKSTLEIECRTNGNLIVCAGIDNPEKLKSISGISSIWIEEATELTFADFLELNRRLRGTYLTYKQIILSYNPINYYHWLNQKIHKSGMFGDRTALIHTTWRDNLFLDKESVKELQEQKESSVTHAAIYDLGQWAKPEHVVYSNHVIRDTVQPYNVIQTAYGIDFGMNSPLAIIRIEWEEFRRVHLSEVLYDTEVSDSILHEVLNSEIPKGSRGTPIYCDSAEPNRIEELRLKGFNALPANKAVIDGIRYVQNNVLIIEPNSPNLEKEIGLYEFKQLRGMVLDEPIKLLDHALDAVRYGMYTHGKKYILPREGRGSIALPSTSRTPHRTPDTDTPRVQGLEESSGKTRGTNRRNNRLKGF